MDEHEAGAEEDADRVPQILQAEPNPTVHNLLQEADVDEREAGAEEDADCLPHTSVPLAWTRVDRVIARRMRTQRKAAELEYLVKWQVRLILGPSPRPQPDTHGPA